MTKSLWIILVSLGCLLTSCEISKKKSNICLEEWEQKRMRTLQGMQDVMGHLPDTSDLPPLDIQFSDSLKKKSYTRYTISFTAAENEEVPAYLYVPGGRRAEEKHPAMLALHETDPLGKGSVDGQGERPNLRYAKELAQRGYVVIAPDYPDFGDLQGYDFNGDRYQSGAMKGVFNHMRSVDVLQSREYVDPERIGVIGHSLGGHNAMFIGAFDTRLKVIVSSSGWTLFDYYDIGEEATKKFGGQLGPWAQDRYMPLLRNKYNLQAEKIPFDFDDVIAAIAPRAFFSNSPRNDSNFAVAGVKEGMTKAREIYRCLEVKNKLQVRYPDAGHDFPTQIRLQAYHFIDKELGHMPN